MVGRAETLSSVFFLAAFILYTKSTKRKHVTGINKCMIGSTAKLIDCLYTVLQLLYINNIINACLYDLQAGDICSCP